MPFWFLCFLKRLMQLLKFLVCVLSKQAQLLKFLTEKELEDLGDLVPLFLEMWL